MQHPSQEEIFRQQRHALAERLSRELSLSDPRITAAFAHVPRHAFVPQELAAAAYEDRALPLGEGQTISQPTMIAIMLEVLGCKAHDRVLEIGAGSGYAAALLGQLAERVYAVEILPNLVQRARATLARLETRNVTIVQGDGQLGLPAYAPYDRILVSAAPEHVPDALVAQLAEGGRIAIPVGDAQSQVLRLGQRIGGELRWQPSVPCMFVPLVSA